MFKKTNKTERYLTLNIPFEDTASAALAYEVLRVDKDFKGSKVRKELFHENKNLIVKFYSSDLKILRVAFNTFIKNSILVAKTIKQFPIN